MKPQLSCDLLASSLNGNVADDLPRRASPPGAENVIAEAENVSAGPDPGDHVSVLRQRGLRATSARVAVLAGLGEIGHATTDQLHLALVPRLPALSLSTVYRALEVLTEHDLIRHAHLGGSAPSYYLASEAEHAHLVCSRCGSVENLTGQPLERLVSDLARSARFAVNTSHLSIEGICAVCQQITPEARTPTAATPVA